MSVLCHKMFHLTFLLREFLATLHFTLFLYTFSESSKQFRHTCPTVLQNKYFTFFQNHFFLPLTSSLPKPRMLTSQKFNLLSDDVTCNSL
jgi:hypothetical protein